MVRPFLCDSENDFLPESLVQFEKELLEKVLESGVRHRKEVFYLQLHVLVRPRW
jgi:hypothetical protein